nr:hypothetical protein [Angustibacter aerolatus]
MQGAAGARPFAGGGREVRDPHPQQPRPLGAPDLGVHAGGARRPARAGRRVGPRLRRACSPSLSSSGELLSGEALGDPSTSTVFGWTPQGHVAMDGPYAEAKEQAGRVLRRRLRDPRARRRGRRPVRRAREHRRACDR